MKTNIYTPGYFVKHGINQHLFKCVQPRAQKQRTPHETKMNAKMILKHAHSGLLRKTWNKSTPFRVCAQKQFTRRETKMKRNIHTPGYAKIHGINQHFSNTLRHATKCK